MIEYKQIKKRYFYLGVELADCIITYPFVEDLSKLNEFYEAISKNAFEWFINVICKKSGEEYEIYEDVKKRFRKKIYKYTLEISVSEENDDFLVAELKASLTNSGEKLSEFSSVQVWDKQEGIIIKRKNKKETVPK